MAVARDFSTIVFSRAQELATAGIELVKPQPLFSELGTILFSKQNYSSVSEQLLSVLVNDTLQFSEQNRDDVLDSWSVTRRLEAPKS
jgi:hypothetical protein